MNKIHSIIKEEAQKLLNENYVMEHDNFKFKQKVKTISFNNSDSFLKDSNIDTNKSNITINWRVIFWLNESGIENFIIAIDNVEGTYHINQKNNKQTDNNIAEIKWKFETNDVNLKTGNTLYVNSLDFDFNTKVCLVTFDD